MPNLSHFESEVVETRGQQCHAKYANKGLDDLGFLEDNDRGNTSENI